MSSAWKDAERQVAKLLGGTRRVRVSYSESCEDVHHAKYAIEVKYGKQVPKWVAQIKEPTLLNDLFLLWPLGEYNILGPVSISSFTITNVINRKRIEFIIDGMTQAGSYNTTKRPMLCMKPPRYGGIVACMYIMDVLEDSLPDQ